MNNLCSTTIPHLSASSQVVSIVLDLSTSVKVVSTYICDLFHCTSDYLLDGVVFNIEPSLVLGTSAIALVAAFDMKVLIAKGDDINLFLHAPHLVLKLSFCLIGLYFGVIIPFIAFNSLVSTAANTAK